MEVRGVIEERRREAARPTLRESGALRKGTIRGMRLRRGGEWGEAGAGRGGKGGPMGSGG